jgi:hypothetical protein
VSNNGSRKLLGFVVVWLLVLGGGAAAYKFLVLDKEGSDGPPPGGGPPIDPSKIVQVPFILWGGDVATFLANGGLVTKPGTLFDKQNLKLKLTAGDDFEKQVKDYLENKTPFLRGTMSMLGEVSEKIGKTETNRPVVFLQMTWSAGDHMIGRASFPKLADLKGKKIALQKGGPHVGMLNDVLVQTAKLTWKDIQVAWTEDVTGEKGPAELFRKDPTVDACFVVTPDMTDLTGGVDKTGTGARGTIEGAHVLVSTKTSMSRSIADVYACRKDFFDAHKDVVEKFAAGYLRACEELQDLRKSNDPKNPSPQYKGLLELTQEIYGKDIIKTLDDADGLIEDANFVYLPGNVSFFTDASNLRGYRPTMKAAIDLAIALNDATSRHDFLFPDFNYEKLRGVGGLTLDPYAPTSTIAKNYKLPEPENLKKTTVYAFEINFAPEQETFPEEKYSEQFKRAAELASLYGKAVIAVRGHSDPVLLFQTFVQEAKAKKVIVKQQGDPGKRRYFLADDSFFELSDRSKVVQLIEKHQLMQSQQVLDNAINLSRKRATAVRNAVIAYAKAQNYKLDENQIVAVGVGIAEPEVAVPRRDEEMARNRRVEFRLIRVSTEALTATGLDY